MLYSSQGGSGIHQFNTYELSWGTTRPSTGGYGTAITASTSGYGAWAEVFTATSLDSYGMFLRFNTAGTSIGRYSVAKIGIDITGGTSYTDLITGIQISMVPSYTWGYKAYYFPMFIPAGTRMAAAVYSSNTASALNLAVELCQQPRNPETVRCASYSETIGESTYYGGFIGSTSLGSISTRGSWINIGTTTKNLWWWQVNGANSGASAALIDFAVGDGTNFDIILQDVVVQQYATSISHVQVHGFGCERYVPAGTDIYVRSTSAAAITTQSVWASVIGCGG